MDRPLYILIPLGGVGKRFSSQGYTVPKPLIKVLGKGVIRWLLESINADEAKITKIIIPYHPILKPYRFEDQLRFWFPNAPFHFVPLVADTLGAADTVRIGLEEVGIGGDNGRLLCLDGDNFYKTDIIDTIKNLDDSIKGGVISTQLSNHQRTLFSYLEMSNDPREPYRIARIVEKVRISDLICTGGYYFNSISDARQAITAVLAQSNAKTGEYFMSSVIQYLINAGQRVDAIHVRPSDFVCLGTPLQIRTFCAGPVGSGVSYRFCFDIDNTLLSYPSSKGDYATARPIPEMIDHLKRLKAQGHTIILYTARGMRSAGGNIGKAMSDVARITLDSLAQFNIPFDEIYFGKPYAHFYIDDLAISAFDDLYKSTGFYDTDIQPRAFHKVSATDDYFLKEVDGNKKHGLDGEKFWYENIPSDITSLFPKLIEAESSQPCRWLKLERIHGISLTKLWLDQCLSISDFDHFLSTMERIHKSEGRTPPHKTDIYANYLPKMLERLGDPSGWDPTTHRIYEKMLEYQARDRAVMRVIHGDPVFTNIMVESHGDIRFVDMRGMLDDKATIYGDVMYDYAKILQSLIGYDEVLMGKRLPSEYKNMFIEHYKQWFISRYGKDYWQDLQWITASMIITLVGLHNPSLKNGFLGLLCHLYIC